MSKFRGKKEDQKGAQRVQEEVGVVMGRSVSALKEETIPTRKDQDIRKDQDPDPDQTQTQNQTQNQNQNQKTKMSSETLHVLEARWRMY